MSEKDGFTGGFLAGAIIGGLVGGALGTLLASRQYKTREEDEDLLLDAEDDLSLSADGQIEIARRSLEDQITQLNLAIDDVRQQLETVNHNSLEKES